MFKHRRHQVCYEERLIACKGSFRLDKKRHVAPADCCGAKKLELFLFYVALHLSATATAATCRFAANFAAV